MNDRSQDVRSQFYNVLQHWMTSMEVHYLKEYEADFVQFLLNGIADEALDISPRCVTFLEEHGNRMKDALIQLGDLEDDEKNLEENQVPKGKSNEDEAMTQDGQIVA